jgi:integrase
LFPENPDELTKIWHAFEKGLMCYLMSCTGMRKGEVTALTWKKINFMKKYVVIDQAVKSDFVIGPPKNNKGRAALLTSKALAFLIYWRERTVYAEDNDFIFPGQLRNKFLDPAYVSAFIKGIFIEQGFDLAGRNISSSHVFRRSYVSHNRRYYDEQAFNFVIGHNPSSITNLYDKLSPVQIYEQLLDQGRIPA